MKQSALILFAFITTCLTTFAQNDTKALDVLNKASAAYNKAGGVKAGFNLTVLDFDGQDSNKIKGTAYLKGSKFRLEVEGMTTWFDGKNQWVYLTSNNEVSLSNPSEEELLTINPINVFELYKNGYSCKWLGQKTEGGKAVLKISMTPDKKEESVQSIVATFDKTSYRPLSINITNKDKSGSKITIPTYATGQNYTDTQFVFPQKKYPNTEVIDLR